MKTMRAECEGYNRQFGLINRCVRVCTTVKPISFCAFHQMTSNSARRRAATTSLRNARGWLVLVLAPLSAEERTRYDDQVDGIDRLEPRDMDRAAS